jgi:hypothetical protein
MVRTFFDLGRKMGINDSYFGRRVRSLVEQLEFTDVGQEGWTRVNRGGDLMSRLHGMTLQASAKPMIDAGLITQQQHESGQRLLSDSDFYYPGATLFAAWGRRPVRKSRIPPRLV